MLAFANAKINLGLHVTEKRPDGYHNLETVFYPVKIYDVVELTDADQNGCEVKGTDIPGDTRDNICFKAFETLQQDFALPPQKITLLKNIPVGAGLGGGSSDAAFLIKLVNDKFGLGLSVSQMEDYARPLGADCAFFIQNKPVYAFGRGDQFAPLDIDLSNYYLVLVKPPVHVSTAAAYLGITPSIPSTSLKDLIHLPLENWKTGLKNDFEGPVFMKYPETEQIKTRLYNAGAMYAAMSGSGSSVFGIFRSPVRLTGLEKDNQVFYGV
ncbi:MAG TPA: 4-(cytidine 5'-diphospho)-2-C-methyl-D-erythritol kinase [Pedobacter sp.]|uniref:4-(cytidine 5'-diphospho)-2-C-methyl-D-erythritol kinase n=1 Tax=Pedobacter sp. TaxID=1411316 RepID=UPI002BB57014|nr:4-(cytidine 5'-diphospho)-2-C-methyl-D-erythritol kinase [Pedobacter sp.]HMI04374.1 4-(cytidine 5'-diphospho)-2-C-methyl-D-erythritol kinase [Pedobacter sp.]